MRFEKLKMTKVKRRRRVNQTTTKYDADNFHGRTFVFVDNLSVIFFYFYDFLFETDWKCWYFDLKLEKYPNNENKSLVEDENQVSHDLTLLLDYFFYKTIYTNLFFNLQKMKIKLAMNWPNLTIRLFYFINKTLYTSNFF